VFSNDNTLWRERVPNNAARVKSRAININLGNGAMKGRRGVAERNYRLAGALAILVNAGVAAILTSTSLTGCSVQAWVT
jgi:hypothetical protein